MGIILSNTLPHIHTTSWYEWTLLPPPVIPLVPCKTLQVPETWQNGKASYCLASIDLMFATRLNVRCHFFPAHAHRWERRYQYRKCDIAPYRTGFRQSNAIHITPTFPPYACGELEVLLNFQQPREPFFNRTDALFWAPNCRWMHVSRGGVVIGMFAVKWSEWRGNTFYSLKVWICGGAGIYQECDKLKCTHSSLRIFYSTKAF